MIASIVVWLANRVATPTLGLIGGGLAILGHVVRVGIFAVIEVHPNAAVDLAIVTTIMLMFIGLALLGIATVRAHVLTGPSAWAPLIVLSGGLIAAPFYSFDKVVHLRPAVGRHLDVYGTGRISRHDRTSPDPAGVGLG